MSEARLAMETTRPRRAAALSLNSVKSIAFLAIAGTALCAGLLILLPIVIAVCWFKFNLRWTGVLIILGLALLLAVSAVWLAARLFLKQARWMMRYSNSPEVSAFSTYTTAVLAILCI